VPKEALDLLFNAHLQEKGAALFIVPKGKRAHVCHPLLQLRVLAFLPGNGLQFSKERRVVKDVILTHQTDTALLGPEKRFCFPSWLLAVWGLRTCPGIFPPGRKLFLKRRMQILYHSSCSIMGELCSVGTKDRAALVW
jgi:hypothetical protein